ncbi:hypothetical protein [Methanosarcina sp.]|uniref:hypothetical protein n=1 Tax=Methanosarcina sp. TaxID=2213 RepID=UPI002ABA6B48|nr:hypothetical protein [Methanosarcina sp.]MDY9924862.1 hypothetical protein [Methanosarcina sp.]
MSTAYLLPSAVLATVGTMYTIFIAVVIFSAKYFDQNIKDMKRLLNYFLYLSLVVLITLLYNGYILYLQSGGVPASNLHILAKLFPSKNFLYWSWYFFILSSTYILLFSYTLLSFVLLKICSMKIKKLKIKIVKHEEKKRGLRLIHEKRNEKSEKVTKEAHDLEEGFKEFTNRYKEKIEESKEKVRKVYKYEKESVLKAGVTTLEIERMLNPNKIESSDKSENSLKEYIDFSKKIENIEGFPNSLLKEVKEHRECLENLRKELNSIWESLQKIEGDKDNLLEYHKKIEKELTQIEEEEKEMEDQIKEINDTLDQFTIERIKRLLKKLKSLISKDEGE